ncbi:PMEI domain-containing protein [Cephalotus follicularis]|uniref:PMEI domain-containing protein n=1 Tax=Cephalotus follicularis TaxID=3775 RepID=A0A1Q3BUX2_CEPFO|nr:PMEI domain-containing protein [Cephalotus follicularis]
MKKHFPFSSPIFLLHVLIPILLPLIQCDDLIDQTCKETPFYDLCVNTLEPISRSTKTDVKGLAGIMANILLSNVTDTLNYIQVLIKQTTDQQLEKALANCAELYIPEVKYNLPQAIDALMKGDYAFANYVISDAAKEADACERSFSDSTKSPLTCRNQLVSNLCDVAVGILNVLLKS